MTSVLVLDPGESTGWVFRNCLGVVSGGTCPKDHRSVAQLLIECAPDVVVFERFNLYPQMAKSLAWNSFYPCEVIGVIRYICMKEFIPMVEQAPSVKKYFGGFKDDWDYIKLSCDNVTEHTKDAYMHLKYYERNKEKRNG